MRNSKPVLSMLVLAVIACPALAQNKPKLAEAYVSERYVTIDGVQEPDNPTEKNKLICGVDHYECYRTGGSGMVGTDSFCVIAGATPIMGNQRRYQMVESGRVERDRVNLADADECSISQITIDLTSKTAIWLNIRKPNVKDRLCQLLPDRQTYYLHDKIDYHFADLADKPN